MFASPVESTQSAWVRLAFRYLLVTILCAVFGAVYELFSHGVYAYGMLYAFAVPLILGVLPALLFAWYGKRLPCGPSRLLWGFAVSALTVGCLFSGALEIYGTSSELTAVYWLAGGVCMMMGVLIGVFVPGDEASTVQQAPNVERLR